MLLAHIWSFGVNGRLQRSFLDGYLLLHVLMNGWRIDGAMLVRWSLLITCHGQCHHSVRERQYCRALVVPASDL